MKRNREEDKEKEIREVKANRGDKLGKERRKIRGKKKYVENQST